MKTFDNIYEKALKENFSPDQLLAITWFYNYSNNEAIEWVRELRRKTGTTGKIDYRLSFKKFFNISEEDISSQNPNSKSEDSNE